MHGRVGVEVQFAGDAGEIGGVWAGDGVQDEHGVFDAARHGAEFVERPAQRHRAVARDAAVGGAQSGDAAAHAGADDAAAGLAADGETDQARGGGCARSGARAGRAFFEQPRIHGLAAEPNIVERQRAEAELGDEHGARVVQALHHGGVLIRDAVAEWLGAPGGRNAGGVEQVFAAPRDAVQRAAIFAGGDFGVGLLGLLQGEVARERDDAAQRGIKFFEALRDKCG